MAQWTVYEVRLIGVDGDCFDVYTHDKLKDAREDFGSALADLGCPAVALEKVARFDVPGKSAVYTLLATAGDAAVLDQWRTGGPAAIERTMDGERGGLHCDSTFCHDECGCDCDCDGCAEVRKAVEFRG